MTLTSVSFFLFHKLNISVQTDFFMGHISRVLCVLKSTKSKKEISKFINFFYLSPRSYVFTTTLQLPSKKYSSWENTTVYHPCIHLPNSLKPFFGGYRIAGACPRVFIPGCSDPSWCFICKETVLHVA